MWPGRGGQEIAKCGILRLRPAYGVRDGCPEVDSGPFAAHVRGQRSGFRSQYSFDCVDDCFSGLRLAEMIEHHGSRPDLTDGIRDSLPRNIRRGSVDRFKHGWKFAFGVDVG